MASFEELSVYVGAATAVVNGLAALFVGVQVRQAAKATKRASLAQQDEWTRQRKRSTVEFFMSTTETNNRLKAALPFLDRDRKQVHSFIEGAESDPKAAAAIRAYLDYLETIATGVNEGVLALEVVDRMTGGRIIAIAANYAPYIRRRRAELKSEALYIELERLAKELRERRAVAAATIQAPPAIPSAADPPIGEQTTARGATSSK